jgi:DNA repair exonuclease SbcCD ATPase subunit
MTVLELREKVETAERVVANQRGELNRIEKDLTNTKTELSKIKDVFEEEQQIQDILNKAAALSWTKLKDRFELIVGRALNAVFPDRNYKFVVHQETKRGASNVLFRVVEDGVEVDVWTEGGLGVADIIGFALRVSYLALYRPKRAQFLFWDEPFQYLAEEYKGNASRFVRQIAQELGIQIIFVTHAPQLISEAGQVFQLVKEKGTCKAVDVTVRS